MLLENRGWKIGCIAGKQVMLLENMGWKTGCVVGKYGLENKLCAACHCWIWTYMLNCICHLWV